VEADNVCVMLCELMPLAGEISDGTDGFQLMVSQTLTVNFFNVYAADSSPCSSNAPPAALLTVHASYNTFRLLPV